MKTHKIVGLFLVISFLACSSSFAQETKPDQKSNFIDASEARIKVEALGKQFSDEFRNKDSVALANHYLPDGMLGSVKGRDNILSTWHRMIQNGEAKGTPNLFFVAKSVTTDEEFIIELGVAQWADKDGTVKSEGKYLVVYKQVDGELKLYRDWGL